MNMRLQMILIIDLLQCLYEKSSIILYYTDFFSELYMKFITMRHTNYQLSILC